MLGALAGLPGAALPCVPAADTSVSAEDSPVGETSESNLLVALQALTAEFDYRLVTNPNLVRSKSVPPQSRCGSFAQRARRLLESQGLAFEVIGKTLVVYPAQQPVETEATALPTDEEPELVEVVVVGRAAVDGSERGMGSEYGGYHGAADAVIDYKRIADLGITDLASALELVSGVKMEHERYAVIRGMNGRYQSVRLNGAVVPSLDPSSQQVPLDIFPVNILNQVDLHKSVYADSPGSASAGAVNIETRRIPNENSFSLVLGTAYRSGTTGADVLFGHTGDRDWLGVDDGSRKLPDILEASARNGGLESLTEAERKRAGESVPREYALYRGEAGSDSVFHLSGGRYWQGDTNSWGFTASLGYKNLWRNLDLQSQVLNRRSPAKEEPNADPMFVSEQSTHRRLDNVVNINGLLALGYAWDDRHYLGANLLLLRQSTNYSEQIGSEGVDVFGKPDGRLYLRSLLNWTEQELQLGQLYGSHVAGPADNLTVNWQVSSTRSEYNQPYDVHYRYQRTNTTSYWIDFAPGNFGVGWEEMLEGSVSGGLNLSYHWELETWSGELKGGFESLAAEQGGYLLEYTFEGGGTPEQLERNDPGKILIPDHIIGASGQPGVILNELNVRSLNPGELDGNFYAADHDNTAAYLLADVNYGDRWQFVLGARHEEDSVSADFWDQQPEGKISLLDDRRKLGSAAIGYFPGERHRFRLGFSETVVWPGMNELLPRRYEDIDLRIKLSGNPFLDVADSNNWDFQWQYRNSETGFGFNSLLFHKQVDSAIEGVFYDPVIEGNHRYDTYTFANAEAAEVYGFELELDYRWLFGGVHELTLQSSYAKLYSTVALSEEGEGTRPLQGQPDYLSALQLHYERLDGEQSLSLLYKRSGEELYIVSNIDEVAPVYQQPHENLTLAYNWRLFERIRTTFSVDNLLDDEHRYTQGGLSFLEYRQGRKYQLRFAFDF